MSVVARKIDILRKLKQALGGEVIRDVRFRRGKLVFVLGGQFTIYH
jgi:hypothetical protein